MRHRIHGLCRSDGRNVASIYELQSFPPPELCSEILFFYLRLTSSVTGLILAWPWLPGLAHECVEHMSDWDHAHQIKSIRSKK